MMLDSLLRDVRHAFRSLARSPRFALTTILLLAIGIGGNVAIYCFADGLFFRRPPVNDAARVAGIYGTRDGSLCGTCISYPDYLVYKAKTTALRSIALYEWVWAWHGDGQNSRELIAGVVPPEFFDVMDVKPVLGRFFTAEENRSPNAHPVVVLSDHIWRTRFRAEPSAIGSTVRLNRIQFTVIGIAPPEIRWVHSERPVDFWMPFMMLPMGQPETGFLQRHQYGGYDMVGRLAPGFSASQATAELQSIAAVLAAEFQATNKGEGIAVMPLAGIHPTSQSSARGGAWLLAAASVCLLVLACANVGGLLLARAVARRREIAIRYSLGAGRLAVVRQLLVESCILGAGAAAGGVLCGWWITASIKTWTEESYLSVDPRLTAGAIVFATACACACVVLFGIVPAILASRPEAAESLRAGTRTGTRSRLRPVLVSGQIAIGVVLLAGAGLLIESLQKFLAQAGAGADRIAAFRLRPSRLGYSPEKAAQFQRTMLARILTVPGVEGAALARVGPSRRWCCAVPVKTVEESVEIAEVENNHVTPGFLRMLRIPLLEGREIEDRDRAGAPLVAVVNETLARRLWGPRSPIGRTFVSGADTFSVAGLAKDVHPSIPGEPPIPYVYFAYWQKDLSDSRLFVRVAGQAGAFLPRLRSEIVSVDPDVHIGQERSLRDMVAMTYRMEALLGAVLSFCAAMAVFLATAGLYAAIAFLAGQRRREMAIRIAVGAVPFDIAALVIRGGVVLAAAGIAAGLGISLVTSRLLASYLYGVSPLNPNTYVWTSLALLLAALAACALPAMTAARVNPSEALRSD